MLYSIEDDGARCRDMPSVLFSFLILFDPRLVLPPQKIRNNLYLEGTRPRVTTTTTTITVREGIAEFVLLFGFTVPSACTLTARVRLKNI